MPDQTDFNYEEAIHGVLETRIALERAEACVARLQQLLSERPQAFGPLAAAAFRLRDRLIEDLGTLEARMAREKSGAGLRRGRRNPAWRDPDASLADKVALGGQ